MTTSKQEKLLLRFVVLLAICAGISVAAQAPVTLDRTIRDSSQSCSLTNRRTGGGAS